MNQRQLTNTHKTKNPDLDLGIAETRSGTDGGRRLKETESNTYPMAINTRDNFRKIKNTELAFITTQLTKRRDKVSGN